MYSPVIPSCHTCTVLFFPSGHTCTVLLFQPTIHVQPYYYILPYMYSYVIPNSHTHTVLLFRPAIPVQSCYSILPNMYSPAIPSRHTCKILQLVTPFLLLLCQLASGAPFLFDPFLLEDLFLDGGGGIGLGLAGKNTEPLNN